MRSTLAFLAGAGSGSRLAFTYVMQDLLDGTNDYGARAMVESMVVKDRIWRFGLYPGAVAPLLAEYGWNEVEQAGGSDLAARYLQPIGRALPVTEGERSVYAEKP